MSMEATAYPNLKEQAQRKIFDKHADKLKQFGKKDTIQTDQIDDLMRGLSGQ